MPYRHNIPATFWNTDNPISNKITTAAILGALFLGPGLVSWALYGIEEAQVLLFHSIVLFVATPVTLYASRHLYEGQRYCDWLEQEVSPKWGRVHECVEFRPWFRMRG